MTTARDSLVTAATSHAGTTAPSPEYAALVAPGETPERQATMMQMSGCALYFTRGLLPAVFADLPELGAYVTGRAFADLWTLVGGYPGKEGSAARVSTLDAPPQPGDAIVYDAGPGGPQHVDGCMIADGTFVAGGQRNGAGLEMVAEVHRDLRWDGHRLIDHVTGRPVICIIDADKLAERYTLAGVSDGPARTAGD